MSPHFPETIGHFSSKDLEVQPGLLQTLRDNTSPNKLIQLSEEFFRYVACNRPHFLASQCVPSLQMISKRVEKSILSTNLSILKVCSFLKDNRRIGLNLKRQSKEVKEISNKIMDFYKISKSFKYPPKCTRKAVQ